MRAGLNPASGSPFADNGAVPDGSNVAFIQSGTNSSLSTVISGLAVGETYKVNFRVNARSYLGTTPNLKVDFAGTNVINTTVAANGYQYFAFDFTAAAATQTLTLRNDATNSDNTVLVDDYELYSPGFFSGANNLTNGVARLAGLGNYGGPTQTLPPRAGSPAIDAGNDPVTNFIATDQRGFPRKIGVHVDIGAVEYVARPVVTTNADSGDGSLRDAITFSTNGTTITFASALSGQTNLG